jgi:hypothetical protein
MRRWVPLIFFAFLTLGASPVRANDDGRLNLFGHHYSVIVGASDFRAREEATQSMFGSQSIEPVVDLWSFRTQPGLGLSWSLGGHRMQEDGRRASFLHGGVGPRFQFVSSRATVAPYLTVRGGVYLVRLEPGSWHTKPGMDVELGASIARHFVLSAGYDMVPKVEGFDLSGFTVRAAVKIF